MITIVIVGGLRMKVSRQPRDGGADLTLKNINVNRSLEDFKVETNSQDI
jgi:hypothetical protein